MRPFHGDTKLSVMAVSTDRVPLYVLHSAVPDPDLEIRGGGGYPDPGISGGGGLQKYVSALRALVWSKNRGAGPCDGRFFLFETNLRLNGNSCLTHDKTGEN